MTETKDKDDIFDDENVVPNNWVKWGKVGDNIKGTLVAVRTMESRLPGKEGEEVNIYEIKADGGEFHDMDADNKPINPPIEVRAGEYWNIGGKDMLDRQFRNIKNGTKVGLKFTEEIASKTKGFNATKVLKVYVPRGKDNNPLMDEAWLEEQQDGFSEEE